MEPEVPNPHPHVTELTTINFCNFFNNNEYVLVEFHAYWREHCMTIKPECEKLVIEEGNLGLNVKIARLEADKNGLLADKFMFPGYSDVNLSNNGILPSLKN